MPLYPDPARIPALVDYDWPGPPPLASQKTTAAFLLHHERAFVLSEMGTGKTRAALYALDALRIYRKKTEGCRTRALIVAPLSTLVAVWHTELSDVFSGRMTAVVLHGSRAKRLERLQRTDWDVAIINPAGLNVVCDGLRRARFDVVIIDELATFRSRHALQTVALQRIVGASSPHRPTGHVPRWVWGLTGTPTPNVPTDAWSLKAIIRPHEAGSFRAFQTQTMIRSTQGGVARFVRWQPRDGAAEIVSRYLQPAICYRRVDVVDLPPVTTTHRYAPLSPEQVRRLTELRRHAATMIAETQVTAANAAVLVGKYLQICSGSVIDDNGAVHHLACKPRLALLGELFDQASGKILVFANYRGTVERVAGLLQRAGVPAAAVHGDVPFERRAELFADFQSSDRLRAQLAHPGTMAHGLTLTAASTVIWFGPVWSAEIYMQACARVSRIGQKRTCQIIRLYGSPVEHRAYNLIDKRLSFQDNVLELVQTVAGASVNELDG